MHIAYFGSPQISAELLAILLDQYDLPISLIVTQSDKPVGKRLQIEPTTVKALGLQHKLAIFDKPLDGLGTADLIQALSQHAIDLCIVFAYGKIISQELLNHTTHGFWNVHPSLLPKYRGPTPTVFPIIMGDSTTGTTLIRMNAQMDEGDILAQTQIPIDHLELREDIEDKLVTLAGEQIHTALQSLSAGALTYRAQEHELATYTTLLSRMDGFIEADFIKTAIHNGQITESDLPHVYQTYFGKNKIQMNQSFDAKDILRSLFRALTPWPGLWTTVPIAGVAKRLKIIHITLDDKISTSLIQTVQLEGKNQVDFATFCRAYSCFEPL